MLDEGRFSEIVAKKRPALIRLAFSYVNCNETAKDIVQDMVVDAWLYHRNGNQIRNLGGLLYKMVRYGSLRYLKQQAKQPRCLPLEDDWAEGLSPLVADPCTLAMSRLELEEAVASLKKRVSEKCWRTVLLFHYFGYDQKEIADAEGVKQQAISNRLAWARGGGESYQWRGGEA